MRDRQEDVVVVCPYYTHTHWRTTVFEDDEIAIDHALTIHIIRLKENARFIVQLGKWWTARSPYAQNFNCDVYVKKFSVAAVVERLTINNVVIVSLSLSPPGVLPMVFYPHIYVFFSILGRRPTDRRRVAHTIIITDRQIRTVRRTIIIQSLRAGWGIDDDDDDDSLSNPMKSNPDDDGIRCFSLLLSYVVACAERTWKTTTTTTLRGDR